MERGEVGATDSKSNLGPKWLLDIATITTCRGQAGFCKLMTKLANFMPVNLVGKEGEPIVVVVAVVLVVVVVVRWPQKGGLTTDNNTPPTHHPPWRNS
uniref:HDC02489 n=1 Tax=Drosophila melanogaster TaxID=7227 RepID=Q6IHJ4_DROME|nr:TPA_inf: HDC02489 [Drosophila melanogaster]